jgi:hypothetical protein
MIIRKFSTVERKISIIICFQEKYDKAQKNKHLLFIGRWGLSNTLDDFYIDFISGCNHYERDNKQGRSTTVFQQQSHS